MDIYPGINLDALLEPPEKKGGTWRCECNLFAKFLYDRHYYNGEFDMYSYTVDCKRCGIVVVDCV